jgi:hypothetical protein
MSSQPLSANSTPNLTLLTESKKGPELSHCTTEVQSLLDLCLIQEACKDDEQNNVKSVCSKKWAGSSEAHASSYTSNPTLLRFEFGSDVERNMCNIDQPDSSGHMGVTKSDSVLLQKGDNVKDETAAKRNALCDVTVAKSKLHVLSNSDPNLLHSWEIESARKRQSVLSSSVPNLVLLFENGRSRKRNGFRAPKSYHVIQPTDKDCGTLTAVGTPSPAVILRSRGIAQAQSIRPQGQVKTSNKQSLYDIEWSFPESRKKSCSHIAKFALNSPLNNDRQQLPHLSRPRSSPAHICKSLQQLCVLCQQTVMSACFMVMFVMWRGMIVPTNHRVLPFSCVVILMSLLCSSTAKIQKFVFSHPRHL